MSVHDRLFAAQRERGQLCDELTACGEGSEKVSQLASQIGELNSRIVELKLEADAWNQEQTKKALAKQAAGEVCVVEPHTDRRPFPRLFNR